MTVLDRGKGPLGPLRCGITYVSGDFGDPDMITDLLKSHDEVVDLAYATVPNTSFSDPLSDILQNLPSAVQLFKEAASIKKIRRLLFVSSGGTVYGDTNTLPIKEEFHTYPISPYGVTKLTIEKYAYLYFATQGLPVICLRHGNAFGEGQRPYSGQGFIATAIASIMDGRPIQIYGQSGTVRDYIHAYDIAQAIVMALDKGVTGETYNVGSGIGLNNTEVIDAIMPHAQSCGYRVTTEHLPQRPFDVQRNVLDSTKLRKHTGWNQSIIFKAGIQRTWEWFIKKV